MMKRIKILWNYYTHGELDGYEIPFVIYLIISPIMWIIGVTCCYILIINEFIPYLLLCVIFCVLNALFLVGTVTLIQEMSRSHKWHKNKNVLLIK